MAAEAIIEAHGVRRMFGEDQGLRDLTLTVPAGKIFGLVGPSGAGKSTAVRLILGTDTPDEGDLLVLDRQPADFQRRDRRRIGYLAQQPTLYPELSIRHNLQLAASLYGMPWRGRFMPGKQAESARQRLASVLDFVDLDNRQRTRLRDASGGEQRRLGLAVALVHEPELLILDEPTAGVDPVLRRRIWERLRLLRDQGTSILVTTQYVEEASDCDVVALMVAGRIALVDSPEELRRRAFGDTPPEDATFDDVFVELLEQHKAAEGGSSSTKRGVLRG